MTDLKLNNLGESLLVLTAIENFIGLSLKLFPNKPVGQSEDLKFILSNSIILEICKFMEEFNRYLKDALISSEKKEILKILDPLYEPLENSRIIRVLRNRNIAHPHRDRDGNFSPAIANIIDKEIPVAYAETLFLGYCTINFIIKLKLYLKNEFKSASKKYKNWLSYDVQKIEVHESTEIKSVKEIKDKLTRILNEVSRNFKKYSY